MLETIRQDYQLFDMYARPGERDFSRIYLTGIQALVRIPLLQRWIDEAAGLNTAGFISGYRGSPLGGYDKELWRAKKFLAQNEVHFEPGLNEDLAATAVMGTQQIELIGHKRYDGVFGMWYGKGPGVDRSGDVFRHANAFGTARYGGALAIAGDDHPANSSIVPHQTDQLFEAVMMPVLAPANVAEVIDLGLAGIALSRFSGLWVAMKTIAEVVESAASISVEDLPRFVEPADFVPPPHGLNIDPGVVFPRDRLEYERRILEERLPAALAWARANKINYALPVAEESAAKRVGIITVGKAHLDVMQALAGAGVSIDQLNRVGVRFFKVGMPWPLEPETIKDWSRGFERLIVVEEKRSFVERQLRDFLYNLPADQRPEISGKIDQDRGILPAVSEFDVGMVAKALGKVFRFEGEPNPVARRFEEYAQEVLSETIEQAPMIRKPFFCAGCPHNTSTKVPEGAVGAGGIGCHIMVMSQPKRNTAAFTHMGGEGVQWVGQFRYVDIPHLFQNLGDGTYQHSGHLAIRQAVAAKAPITYKILYNDAVAMTGGQPAEGQLSPQGIAQQVHAEGVDEVIIVTDEPERYTGKGRPMAGVEVHHRDDLPAIQERLQDRPGVSVIIYDQTCAAEKRRRRKKGQYPDPAKRLFINERVCEGCGDCSVQSNCIAVEPIDTEYGRKRAINQSTCNKDFSCVKGFCPSFVSVIDPELKRPDGAEIQALESDWADHLPDPERPRLGSDHAYNIVVTGIGGTGVITIGALLGMAAHLEGQEASVLDFTGLAQKNGAVTSHVRIGKALEHGRAVRIPARSADLLLGCDMVVSANAATLKLMSKERSNAIVNLEEAPTSDYVDDQSIQFPTRRMMESIARRSNPNSFTALNATDYAVSLFGDSIASNLFMLGVAAQAGHLPVSLEALDRAIELNGVSIDMNKRALAWGRLFAADRETFEAKLQGLLPTPPRLTHSVDELIEDRSQDLVAYQNADYALRYRKLVDLARSAEARSGVHSDAFTEAVARYFYKLMAYKDEYEVARLYTDPAFMERLHKTFSGHSKLKLNMAPPIISRRDPHTGHLVKREFGPWIFTALKALARMRGLRGTMWDPFGRTEERRMERQLVDDYEAMITRAAASLNKGNHAAAVALARWPDTIRGFGHIKAANFEKAMKALPDLIQAVETPDLSGRGPQEPGSGDDVRWQDERGA